MAEVEVGGASPCIPSTAALMVPAWPDTTVAAPSAGSPEPLEAVTSTCPSPARSTPRVCISSMSSISRA